MSTLIGAKFEKPEEVKEIKDWKDFKLNVEIFYKLHGGTLEEYMQAEGFV